MAEIEKGGGVGPVGPQDKKVFEQEYKHGADLFQRALQQYAKSKDLNQKEEFKEVMDKAMRVLNETAKELKERERMRQSQQIEEDYKAYQANPSPEAQKKLNADLDQAKRNLF